VPRAIWKGAISFGLVHIPVSLYPAAQDSGIDFDWLDRRSLDPVGYKRYNKRSGKELKPQDIVKGVKQPDGTYVVVSEDDLKAAFPKSTQTIEIESFVKEHDVPAVMFERPYYLEPSGKAERVYALLLEAMRSADVIAIARVVMHTKEHLAALIPSGPVLVLNTIRWAGELRPTKDLTLPGQGSPEVDLKPTERKMAAQLIEEMTGSWKSAGHSEHFTSAIRALIKRKVEAGEAKTVEPLEESSARPAASNVVDLTELLTRSLAGRRGSTVSATPSARSGAAPNPIRKRVARRRSRSRA
jgi:DNA end-binding protein Ku